MWEIWGTGENAEHFSEQWMAQGQQHAGICMKLDQTKFSKPTKKGKGLRNSRYFIFDKDSHEFQISLVVVGKRYTFAASFLCFRPCFQKLQSDMTWQVQLQETPTMNAVFVVHPVKEMLSWSLMLFAKKQRAVRENEQRLLLIICFLKPVLGTHWPAQFQGFSDQHLIIKPFENWVWRVRLNLETVQDSGYLGFFKNVGSRFTHHTPNRLDHTPKSTYRCLIFEGCLRLGIFSRLGLGSACCFMTSEGHKLVLFIIKIYKWESNADG